MSGKKLKTDPKKVLENSFSVATPDTFQDYCVAAVTTKQSPFRPVIMYCLTRFFESEARQSFFPFGLIRSCWAQILGKEFPLHLVCLRPSEDLGFRRMAFSTSRKSLAEQEFGAKQSEPPFLPLHQCDAIALFPQLAFSLGE